MQRRICFPFSVFICSLIFIATANAASMPDWAKNFDPYQKYPAETHLAGLGTSEGNNSEALRIAEDNARAAVSRMIVVDIESLLRTAREEDEQKFSQHLSSITQSSTSIQLMGLEIETFADDNPPMAYALAYVSKAELRRIYSKRKSDLTVEIRKVLADAKRTEQNSMTMEAARKYLSLYPLYESLKEAETILLVIGGESRRLEDAFSELDAELGESSPASDEAPLISWTEVANKIDELLSQDMESVDDLARSVIIQLSKQAGDLNGRILINPFTYQDTKMGSSFARYFKSALENQMGLMSGLKWDTVIQARDFKPKSINIMNDLAKASGAQWTLSGTYWEQGDKIKLMASLKDVSTGKILAGADMVFDANMLESSHLSSKPENFQQAVVEQRAFSEDQVISSQLQIDLWTDKGSDAVTYTEGELMKVYIRVNRPAYVRLLYTLADMRRTLLFDNYYVDMSKVNRPVELPDEFECAPPFGAEMMVALARTEPFEPVETVEEGGYDFLKAQSSREAAIASRGMIRRRRQDTGDSNVQQTADASVQQTEARIVITTMEN